MKTMHSTRKTLLLSVLTAIFAMSLTVLAIMGFASKSAFTADAATNGITDMNVSLGEDIVVKYYTDATADDCSYLEVVFNGETFKIEEHVDGVFAFNGVAPQQMGDVMEATLKASDGTAIGETKQQSVKSYLEAILALSQEDGQNPMQYAAMKELAVDLLNYGAAAQTYVGYNTDALANVDLTTDQAALATGDIAVAASDKASTGDMFVGAGVRFDSKLGLYFVFEAEDTANLTLKINGEDAEYKAYTTAGQYIAYYDNFTATDMNKSVTAVLSDTTGELATATYSLKAYVNSYGSADNALANLINATYAYGYAAVAYSNVVGIDPTAKTAGSYGITEPNGYDYEGSAYEAIELPAFNGTDYDTNTTWGSDSKGTATVIYTLKANNSFVYSEDYTSNIAIKVGGTLYRYVPNTLDTVNVANLTISYVEATGDASAYYSFAATGGTATVEKLLAYGDAPVVITGDVVIYQNEKISNNGGFIVGSETVAGNVTINQAAAQDGMQLWNNAFVTVENGTLTINGYEGIASGKTAIYSSGCAFNLKEKGNFVVNYYNNYFTGSAVLNLEKDFIADKGITCKSITSTARLIIDNEATVKVTGNLGAKEYTVYMKKSLTSNSNAEFGYDHALFVKNGTLSVTGNLRATGIQVGSMLNNTKGVLNVTSDGDALTRDSGNSQYDFANGEVSFASSATGKSLIMVNNAQYKITVNVMQNCTFSADNYTYIFYLNKSNTVSSFNYFAENLMLTNCTNYFVGKTVNVNVKTATQMEVEHEGTTDMANVILTGATQTGCTAVVDGNYAPTTSSYESYEFVSWVA